ncbi:MAG: vWA domain-containing protein [Opitutia bacterium]
MSTPNNAASTPLPRLEIHPLKKGLPRGQALATKALVRVVSDAPVTEQQRQRAPIDLAIVIDRSGSMSGEPLAAALGCARNLIRGLRETDRVAVVVFDNQVNVLQPLAQVADRETVCRVLAEVRAGGSTALFAGWEEGARQLAPFTSANRTSRVILLTDGQANQGLVNEDEIAAKVRELAKAGVTTSTVGLGGQFNETLLSKMADAGEGQAHYGQRPEDLEEGFAEEFAILSKAHLRQLELRVTAGEGVVAKVLRNDGSRGDTSRLGTLPCSASRDAVLVLEIGASRSAGGVVSVTATAKDATGAAVTLGPAVLSLPELEPAAHAELPEDPAVAAAVAESDFADEFLRIHELASRGRVGEALAALRALRSRPGATAWAEKTAKYILNLADDDLESALKELVYSSRGFRGRTKSARIHEAYSNLHCAEAEFSADIHLSKKIGMGRNRNRAKKEEQQD